MTTATTITELRTTLLEVPWHGKPPAAGLGPWVPTGAIGPEAPGLSVPGPNGTNAARAPRVQATS